MWSIGERKHVSWTLTWTTCRENGLWRCPIFSSVKNGFNLELSTCCSSSLLQDFHQTWHVKPQVQSSNQTNSRSRETLHILSSFIPSDIRPLGTSGSDTPHPAQLHCYRDSNLWALYILQRRNLTTVRRCYLQQQWPRHPVHIEALVYDPFS